MNKCGKRNYDIHNYTHNFWMGCRRYSDGCKNCHMWLMQSQRGVDPARIYRCKYQTAYGDVLKLQRQAEAAGKVYTVTACSYSDFFIEEADAWRDDSWAVMKQTPNLVWQLVTKRAENIADRLPADWGTGYRNVWLGVTVESRKYLTRLDTLRRIPCVLRWLNLMPTLEELMPELADHIDGFHWVIQSGEVGCNLVQPRPFDYQWARNIRDLCAKRGIAFAFLHGSGDGWGREALDGVEHRAVPALLDKYRAKMAKAPPIFDRAKLGNCRGDCAGVSVPQADLALTKIGLTTR